MTQTLQYSVTLVKLSCGECHIPFAVPRDLHETLLQTGRKFWCPNGHNIGYSETANARLERELREARRSRELLRTSLSAERDQRQATERSNAALRGVVTRTKRRVQSGTCPAPDCRRHFTDLQRHISAKHPGYDPADVSR
jgi:hypothetical protein